MRSGLEFHKNCLIIAPTHDMPLKDYSKKFEYSIIVLNDIHPLFSLFFIDIKILQINLIFLKLLHILINY